MKIYLTLIILASISRYLVGRNMVPKDPKVIVKEASHIERLIGDVFVITLEIIGIIFVWLL